MSAERPGAVSYWLRRAPTTELRCTRESEWRKHRLERSMPLIVAIDEELFKRASAVVDSNWGSADNPFVLSQAQYARYRPYLAHIHVLIRPDEVGEAPKLIPPPHNGETNNAENS